MGRSIGNACELEECQQWQQCQQCQHKPTGHCGGGEWWGGGAHLCAMLANDCAWLDAIPANLDQQPGSAGEY